MSGQGPTSLGSVARLAMAGLVAACLALVWADACARPPAAQGAPPTGTGPWPTTDVHGGARDR